MFLFTEEHGAMTTSISRLLSRKATLDDMDESLYRFTPSSFTSDRSKTDPKTVMFFTHVPKSGGTNVRAYYKCVLGPSEMILPNDPSKDEPRYLGPPKESAKTTLVMGRPGSTPNYFGDSHELPKAKAFTMFRHPVERMVSDYYYIQKAHWEPGYDPDLANRLSLVEFAEKHSNFLLGVLLYNHTLAYGDDDDGKLQLAKELLDQYYVVGLTDQMTESLRRFDAYFGIDAAMMKDITTKERYARCKDKFWEKTNDADHAEESQHRALKSNSNEHRRLDPSGEEWKAIEDANSLDMELFHYAEILFRKQGRFFQEEEKTIAIKNE